MNDPRSSSSSLPVVMGPMIADQVPVPPSSDEESSDESIKSGEPIAAYDDDVGERMAINIARMQNAEHDESNQGDSDSDKEHAPVLHTVHVLIFQGDKVTFTSNGPMSVWDIKRRLITGGHFPDPKVVRCDFSSSSITWPVIA